MGENVIRFQFFIIGLIIAGYGRRVDPALREVTPPSPSPKMDG